MRTGSLIRRRLCKVACCVMSCPVFLPFMKIRNAPRAKNWNVSSTSNAVFIEDGGDKLLRIQGTDCNLDRRGGPGVCVQFDIFRIGNQLCVQPSGFW
ncbi:uncharacterized protein LOC117229786 isoform X2 [Megalopta genalis]|uniref:uncharacterized protein LOC117229786 isoform X2 n=1 Tax=Megalopta genalis TaxID=115081 RepID=UPI003FD3A529